MGTHPLVSIPTADVPSQTMLPAVRYPSALVSPLPPRPKPIIRRSGLLGRANPDDVAHARAEERLYNKTLQARQGLLYGAALDVTAVTIGIQAASAMEATVNALPPQSAAAALAAEIAGDAFARIRVRSLNISEAHDAEILNVIRNY